MSRRINKYVEIKAYSPYIRGVVGKDIKLSFIQKLKILFSKGITVALIDERLNKHTNNVKESEDE